MRIRDAEHWYMKIYSLKSDDDLRILRGFFNRFMEPFSSRLTAQLQIAEEQYYRTQQRNGLGFN